MYMKNEATRSQHKHKQRIVTYLRGFNRKEASNRIIFRVQLNLFISAFMLAAFCLVSQKVVSMTNTTTSQAKMNSTQTMTQKALPGDSLSTKQPTTTAASGQADDYAGRVLTSPSLALLPAKLEELGTTPRRRHRQPKIYKLTTNPLNGRLSLPLRINLSDGLLSRPRNQRLMIEKVGGAATPEPATLPPVSSSTTRAPFGTRAQKVYQVNNSSQYNKTEPGCDPEQQEQGSIAASSQTLRLTKSDRVPVIQVPGFLSNKLQQQPKPAQSLSGEVEEVSSEQKEGTTLVATPASRLPLSTTTSNMGVEVSLLEPTTLSSHSPVASGGGSESNSERAGSILTLIDEYDSKIITNRTKGKYK